MKKKIMLQKQKQDLLCKQIENQKVNSWNCYTFMLLQANSLRQSVETLSNFKKLLFILHCSF